MVKKIGAVIFIVNFIILLGAITNARATVFTQIPFTFEAFTDTQLDYYIEGEDDANTGSTPLGFSVIFGGVTYTHFDLDSNGYVELLAGSGDSPTGYGYGYISDLISADPTSTYLLAAYDDLSSDDYGFFGYKLFSERAVFYYDIETYYDEDEDYLNNFEIILYANGNAQWNFNYANYDDYDYDLFSGIYFSNTATPHELYSDYIPEEESWLYTNNVIPEPATMSLFGIGLLGLARLRRKK